MLSVLDVRVLLFSNTTSDRSTVGTCSALGMVVSDHRHVPKPLNLVKASVSLSLSDVRLAFVHIEKWLHNLIWRARITAGQHSLTDEVS